MDANDALNIYRYFCKHTGLVVEYLLVARKLQNLLNVLVPLLSHVGALPLLYTSSYVYSSLVRGFISWCNAGMPRRKPR